MSSRSFSPFFSRRRSARKRPQRGPLSWRRWGVLLALGLLALVARGLNTPQREREDHSAELVAGPHQVKRVVDGDTLELSNGARVRLIGVNTPETVKPNAPVEPFGPEASAMTKEFVSAGEVRLTFDGDRMDKYGRHLAVVWVGEQMLNEELLRAGLAVAEPQYRYSAELKKRFLRAQSEAQAARRGIWSR